MHTRVTDRGQVSRPAVDSPSQTPGSPPRPRRTGPFSSTRVRSSGVWPASVRRLRPAELLIPSDRWAPVRVKYRAHALRIVCTTSISEAWA